MKIHYEIIDGYSRTNQEEIVKFIYTLINLLEIYKTAIPFSEFEVSGFNSLKIEPYIKIINNLKTGKMPDYIGGFHPEALIEVRYPKIIGVDNGKLDFLKNLNLNLNFKENPLPILKSLLKELESKGYGKKKEQIKETNRIGIILEKKGLKRTDENGTERSYPIDRDSDRFTVFETALNEHQKPKNIKLKGKKPVPSVKNDFNKTVGKKLCLPDDCDLIINDGEGYIINDRYEITRL